MTFFKTRYRIRQGDDCQFWISCREWWKPWWAEIYGASSFKAAYAICLKEGWLPVE